MLTGDFARDTAVVGGDGTYQAQLSPAWEIWGPNGGYLAAIALRAAGAASSFKRPASITCHFLSVARFDAVEIEVRSLRRAKRAESLRVTISQAGAPVLEAIAWVVDRNEGLDHDVATMPDVPAPEALRPIEELMSPGQTTFPFWYNFDRRPLEWSMEDPPPSRPPVFRQWIRFRPEPRFEDPFLDAARSLVLIDTLLWPAAWRYHVSDEVVAPSLDVYAHFHRPAQDHEWLLIDAHAPVSADGIIGANARVWAPNGDLLASGSGTLYCRPARRAQF